MLVEEGFVSALEEIYFRKGESWVGVRVQRPVRAP